MGSQGGLPMGSQGGVRWDPRVGPRGPWAMGTHWPLETQWPMGSRAHGSRAHRAFKGPWPMGPNLENVDILEENVKIFIDK